MSSELSVYELEAEQSEILPERETLVTFGSGSTATAFGLFPSASTGAASAAFGAATSSSFGGFR